MNRSRLPVAVFACVLLCALVVATPASHPYLRRIAYGIGILHPTPPLRPGQPLPRLSVAELSGASTQLQPSRGTVVYNIFTSWCPSCRDEAPAFASAAKNLERHGVRVVGIDQGESASAVSAFADAYGLTYPIVIDPSSASTEVLSARVIPETIVVRDGIVQQIAVGPVSASFLKHLAEGV